MAIVKIFIEGLPKEEREFNLNSTKDLRSTIRTLLRDRYSGPLNISMRAITIKKQKQIFMLEYPDMNDGILSEILVELQENPSTHVTIRAIFCDDCFFSVYL